MTVTERVQRHRTRMRERGFRPVQIWVPDVRQPEFVQAAERQAKIVAELDKVTEDQDFIESVSVQWED